MPTGIIPYLINQSINHIHTFYIPYPYKLSYKTEGSPPHRHDHHHHHSYRCYQGWDPRIEKSFKRNAGIVSSGFDDHCSWYSSYPGQLDFHRPLIECLDGYLDYSTPLMMMMVMVAMMTMKLSAPVCQKVKR